jgi:hypothetical protein
MTRAPAGFGIDLMSGEFFGSEPLPRRASNFISGLESMPVTFTPARRVAAP